MNTALALEYSNEVTELGVNCINKSIKAIGKEGSRFRFRDIFSIEILIKNITDLDVAIETKKRIYDNLLPEFSDAIEPDEIEPMDE